MAKTNFISRSWHISFISFDVKFVPKSDKIVNGKYEFMKISKSALAADSAEAERDGTANMYLLKTSIAVKMNL